MIIYTSRIIYIYIYIYIYSIIYKYIYIWVEIKFIYIYIECVIACTVRLFEETRRDTSLNHSSTYA